MTLWMLYALLLGGLAAAAGLALERAARSLGWPVRFVWLAMLAASLVAPAVLPLAAHTWQRATPTSEVGKLERVTMPASADLPDETRVPRFAEVARILDVPLALLWAALSLVCIGRLASAMLALRRQRRAWEAREIEGTPLLVTPNLGPAVVAIPATRIVVPEWMLSLDAGALATVIRHERQHSAAGDAWLVIGGAVATALLPWNPAVWLIRRRLRLALEMDCDARVLAEDPRVDRYGALLLAIAQRPRVAAGLAATLTESPSDLERRIDAMTACPPEHPRLRATLFSAAALALLALGCEMPAPDLAGPRDEKASTDLSQAEVMYDFQVERPASAHPRNSPPQYPSALRAANVEGAVIARFVVDTNGVADTTTLDIVKSDHRAFTVAVRNAVPNMRFFPAEVGGHKVKQLVTLPFSFSLVREPRPESGAAIRR